MYITSISPSSFLQSEDCQMKWFISNLLRIREPSGVAAEKGTIVHAFLEVLALYKKTVQDGDKSFEHESTGAISVTKQGIMDIDLEKLFDDVWRHYVNESDNKFSNKDRKDCWKWINTVLGTENDPRTCHIVGTEKRFHMEIEEPWAAYKYMAADGIKIINGNYTIRGIIDLVTKVDDNTFKFIDWKTGQRKCWITGKRKEYDDLVHDIQLNIYNYCLRKLYPEIEHFIVCIVFMKDGGPYDLVFHSDQLQDTEKKLKEKFHELRNIIVPQQRKSFKCKWCHFYKTKLPDAPVEYRKYQHDEIGENMCMCSDIHLRIKRDGANKVIRDLRK